LLRGGHNDNNAVDTLRDSEKVELDCPINTIAVDGLSHFESTPETNGAIVKHEPQPPSVSRQSTMDHKNANRLPKSLTHSTKWADSQFRSRTRIEAENWIDITNTSPATRPTSANLSPSLAGTMSIFTNAARLDSSAHKMMRQRALERQCRQEQKAHQENAQLRQILLTSERQRRLEEHQGRFQASLSWCCGLSLPG
jgi:hypothetical protein